MQQVRAVICYILHIHAAFALQEGSSLTDQKKKKNAKQNND
jgi:hypothetical protein